MKKNVNSGSLSCVGYDANFEVTLPLSHLSLSSPYLSEFVYRRKTKSPIKKSDMRFALILV